MYFGIIIANGVLRLNVLPMLMGTMERIYPMSIMIVLLKIVNVLALK